MARSIKKKEYDSKVNDILDASLKLIYRLGYSEMSVQDILDELGISKGALYHYFDSKEAILDALVMRMLKQSQNAVQNTLTDPKLTAIKKLQIYFEISYRWKLEQADKTIPLLKAWYSESNDIVRQRLASKIIPQTAMLIEPVIIQGVKEKLFDTRFPVQISLQFAQLSLGVSESVASVILSYKNKPVISEKIVELLDAYFVTIERMLGINEGSINRPR